MHTKAMRSVSSEDIRSMPDARYGPVMGKTATRIRPFGSEPLSAYHGSLVPVGTFPSGFVLGGETTKTIYCREVHKVER
jgi:hypothetical protein